MACPLEAASGVVSACLAYGGLTEGESEVGVLLAKAWWAGESCLVALEKDTGDGKNCIKVLLFVYLKRSNEEIQVLKFKLWKSCCM